MLPGAGERDTMERADVATQTEHYLATGEYDLAFKGWPGDGALDRIRKGSHALSTALVAEVKRRAGNPRVPPALEGLDLVAFGRRKLEPMVRGCYPKRNRRSCSRCWSVPWCSSHRTTSNLFS